MGLRDTASRASTEPKDETYKKIVDKRNVPEIGKGSLYFRFLSVDEADFHHGMEFWLNLGKHPNNPDKDLLLPRISPNPFADFVNQKTGYISRKAPGCPLSDLAEAGHPLIAMGPSYGGKAPKQSISPFHAARIQLVEPIRDKAGKPIKDEKGHARFQVIPEERILKFTQNWWDQFVNLIDPLPVSVEDDGITEVKEPKKFPVADKTRVIWVMRQEVRTKNPTGNPKLDKDYVMDFSDKVWLTDGDIVEVPEVTPYDKVFKVITPAELLEFKAKWENKAPAAGGSSGRPQDDPALYGDTIPGEESNPHVPVNEDDVPF